MSTHLGLEVICLAELFGLGVFRQRTAHDCVYRAHPSADHTGRSRSGCLLAGHRSKSDVLNPQIPPDADVPLPKQAICVMTQERVQLTLASHPDFAASIVVIDEAQSISDGARGVLLQWVRPSALQKYKRSGTFREPQCSKPERFCAFGLDDVKQISSSEPTVAQNFLTGNHIQDQGTRIRYPNLSGSRGRPG